MAVEIAWHDWNPQQGGDHLTEGYTLNKAVTALLTQVETPASVPVQIP